MVQRALIVAALAALACQSNAVRAAAIVQDSSSLKARDIAIPAETPVPGEKTVRQLMESKQFEQAIKQVEALERKQPNNADVLVMKGTVYLAMNNRAEARKAFEQALAVNPSSSAAALHLGQLDLREKNVDAASRRFESVLAREPTNAEAMAGMAGVMAARGREADYVAWLRKAIAAHPSLAWPRLMLAEYHLTKNETRQALVLVQEAQAAHPDDPRVLTVLGSVQAAMGSKESALRTFGKVVSLVPKDASAYWRLGAAQLSVNNLPAARGSANRALALRPDYADAAVLLATIELRARQYGEALKAARNLQRQHPNAAAGWSLEGDVHAAQKQFAAAIEMYEKAFATHKSAALVIKLHQMSVASGKAADGEARLVRWLAEHPDDGITRVYFAETLAQAGRRAPAIEQFQQVVQRRPSDAKSLNNLAWLLYEEKDPRALATARKAYELQHDDPQVLDTLGWILTEQGQVKEGLPHLEKALSLSPQSPGIQYHRAAALAKAGDKKRARRELETLLAKHPKFAQRSQAEALLNQL